MNKILVLAKNQKTYFIRRLLEEVDKSSLDFFDPFNFQDFFYPQQAELILCRTTGVYHSDKDIDFLKNQESKIINPLSSLITFRSKSSQYDFLEKHSFNILPWKKCHSMHEELGEFKTLLIKPDRGQGGRGIKIIQKEKYLDWFTQQKQNNDLDFVVQPYISENKELRVFFIGQKLWVLERWADTGPVNFFQGGAARPAKMNLKLEEEVRRLIHMSKAFYGAIDILIENSTSYFLELNTVPGVEQLEKIFKVNIVKLLIRDIIKD